MSWRSCAVKTVRDAVSEHEDIAFDHARDVELKGFAGTPAIRGRRLIGIWGARRRRVCGQIAIPQIRDLIAVSMK